MKLVHSRKGSERRSAKTKSSAAGMFGPHAIEIHPRHLAVGDGVCRSFAVTGYPREVGLGWLAPLLEHPGRLEIALHVDPMRNDIAADRLRRQLARLESARRLDAAKGRLVDPEVDVAALDARDLSSRLARGEGKLFRLGLYITVHANDLETLDAECLRVRSLASSLLLDVVPVTLGLDQEMAQHIREEILRLNRETGLTILLTTHNLREAEMLCSEVAFLKEGRLAARGRMPSCSSAWGWERFEPGLPGGPGGPEVRAAARRPESPGSRRPGGPGAGPG